ncbi:MAG: Sua5/YciO/YrdC/YwlC family protein [Methylococcales bacterium]|jgi:L-threonylcarbamoyladenylate synthase|nr:tRNA threonylcarbamoyladenosine biosynthesis protein RimN [Methylococcaceae bacterium]HIL41700.1 tRNA threonylcarbamoyladenosine biosynthesis protein RimN [Methylococcales bacterium]
MPYISSFKTRLFTQHLLQGQVIAYPTEAVYGLGCDPLNGEAVTQLLTLKQRPIEKGLILVASSFDQLTPYLTLDDNDRIQQMLSTWPGPTTWVVPAQHWVPPWLRGEHSSLAVRVTNHPIAAALCKAFNGPIVSTSANISDKPAAKTPVAVKKQLGLAVPIFTGDLSKLQQVTPIYDLITGQQFR